MKTKLILFTFLCLFSWLSAQTNLVAYEYWYDDDYVNKQEVGITPATEHEFIADLDVSALIEGIHVFNIRYLDDHGFYSSTLSKIFFKNTEITKLQAYEYWFNNDYANKQLVVITPVSQHELIASFDVNALLDGVNVLNIRYQDENGFFSSTLSKLFVKNSELTQASKGLQAYEYWFNNDYANKQLVSIPLAAQHNLITSFDVNVLQEGVNVFNVRYQDENGIFSSTLSKLFYKNTNQVIANKITAYRFWLDNDFSNAVQTNLAVPLKDFNLVQSIDLSQVQKGQHVINYQFQDSLNVWSVVSSDTIEKLPLPIADFNYAVNASCDSTVVTFIDESIDGDTYFWDFGDGNTDSVLNPLHTYTSPGAYVVSLTVTDTLSSLDSTKLMIVNVYGNTSSSISVSACDSFVAPSGAVYTVSNTYSDTIANQWACDSIITITATINYSSSSTDLISACDTYTWIDGLTYTSSNNTATHTLTNASGCDSIISLNLTINYSNTSTDVITACDTFTWIDGITYTASNNTATRTLTNTNGCDSLVTLNLSLNFSNTGTDVITACDSYTWFDGNTYTTSNNSATFTLTNANGCDSVVTLNLTLNYSNSSTDVHTACDSFTWIDGMTYTSSNNTATHTLTNVSGCDSIVTLDLSINYSSTATDIVTVCDSYTWIDGISYTADNNTASFLLSTIHGCDSIITLNLTIDETPDNSVTQNGLDLSADAIGFSYQWVNCDNNFSPLPGASSQTYTATSNGNYAVIVSSNNCMDTSSCFPITNVSIQENNFKTTILLYPNPSDGHFTVDLGGPYQEINYSIYDLSGTLVLKGTVQNAASIPLELRAAAGQYLLEISDNTHKAIMKIMIH